MDKCKHVGRLRLAQDHSILNPQKWHCADCNTTESVWACLSCSHVACGRYIEEHALRHFLEQRHPLALEVNELYVFCYLCDDYVLNDNATGDLKLLRGTLSAIKSQRYECTTRSGRTLRSAAAAGDTAPPPGAALELQLRAEDRMFTALWHRRRALIGRVFRTWLGLTAGGRRRLEEERRREEEEERRREARERRLELKRQLREELESTPPRKSHRLRRQSQRAVEAARPARARTPRRTSQAPVTPRPAPRKRGVEKTPPPPKTRLAKPRAAPLKAPAPVHARGAAPKGGDSPMKRRPTVTPGVTGLRNLGNTCYMNSILQVLSHLHIFRECFLRLDLNQALELLASAVNGKLVACGGGGGAKLPRLPPPSPQASKKGAGLSGGGSRAGSMELVQPKEPSSKHISLCHELHTLFQVMWSGKWALVSPFAMLHSVWQLIPAFRGYAQQDAQEFLCELLDKVQRELESTGTQAPASAPSAQRRLIRQVLSVVNTIFHGQLLSQVTCLACDHKSNTIEPFWDLSLEFPERYHCNGKETAAHVSCQLTEMLAKFTETEALEGSIYACDQCNSKRRRSSSKPVIRTEAQKQLMIHKLPQVLRLHLKRFRWSGRNHREKIGVHVNFDQVLNMEPYCYRDPASTTSPHAERFLYELSAVVMHHGKGFGSGHYTAFCYNTDGEFWVHCNDSKLNICTVEDVCKAQAYILFYTQRVSQDKGKPL
ncbi:ubiquitin carboxyl-terminal hydrolase 44-like [Megalops cyprinoides]|uniref:ubiquitin carboxyl-terminal hydrolase 44-like n=1 Tax=Megalops cyprinoides TaxID=118141 RepID=UPI00186474A3|nr:ubiquitin carboxyl-terminal hydrolase 44-like [Megalops cyprinoides]XP_036376411.1 ubiquitin carboxyl-terminal hydrolase 44-like [Megalops cyprinoides]